MKTNNGFFHTPHTQPGWWAVGLFGLFAILFLINSTVFIPAAEPLPIPRVALIAYGLVMLACGLASGIVGFVSVVRSSERSWMVWLAILPGLFVLFLLIGEFLFPH